MTIRSEIHAALSAGTPLSAAALLPKVPSLDGDARKLLWNLNALRDEGRIRIAGTTDEGPAYTIDQWEVTAFGRSVSAPRGTGPRAKKGTGKSTKPARGKDAKRDATAGDVDEYEVGLMSDGGLMVHNITQGQIEILPPAFTQQVAQLLQIAARAA